MTGAADYLQAVRNVLDHVERCELGRVDEAATLVADRIATGGSIFVFGTGHAGMIAQESFFRAGGLLPFNPVAGPGLDLTVRPVTLSTAIERMPGYGEVVLSHTPIKEGDVLFVVSTSGRNAVPIDAALWAKERGIPVVGITSRSWAESAESRHPSGKRLHEVVDIVLDDWVPAGDAAVELAGTEQRVGPISTIAGVTLMNLVVIQTAEKLAERGVDPPVFVSANVDGADVVNEARLERYRDQVHYV